MTDKSTRIPLSYHTYREGLVLKTVHDAEGMGIGAGLSPIEHDWDNYGECLEFSLLNLI